MTKTKRRASAGSAGEKYRNIRSAYKNAVARRERVLGYRADCLRQIAATSQQLAHLETVCRYRPDPAVESIRNERRRHLERLAEMLARLDSIIAVQSRETNRLYKRYESARMDLRQACRRK